MGDSTEYMCWLGTEYLASLGWPFPLLAVRLPAGLVHLPCLLLALTHSHNQAPCRPPLLPTLNVDMKFLAATDGNVISPWPVAR